MNETKAGQALKLVAPTTLPKSAPRPRIAIVIPAFNEEKNIENVLREIQALRTQFPQWELAPIVVNDGSTDRTERILNKNAEFYGVHAIHLPINLGIGRAVQTGFQYAVRLGADVTLQLDGDGQHPAAEIPLIVEPVLDGQADVVVGSRYLPGASGNVSTPLRQLGTYFFSALLKALVGLRIRDTTSGFRSFGFEATEFLSRYYPDDYPEVEAYVPLVRRKFRITERAVRMRAREGGRSSITPLRSLYYMIKVAAATIIDVLRPLPERRAREYADPGAGPGAGR
jgi:glycosyltransferase involved in cell wall biosynthesis